MDFIAEVKVPVFLDTDSIDKALSGEALKGAETIQEKIVELMNEPKHGNEYKHKDNTVRPASAAGEAPGIDSKDFVDSFESIELSLLEAEVNSDVEYGNFLQEERERFFTEPAIERALPEIVESVEDKIETEWH